MFIHTRQQGQTAMIVGIFVYLLFGILDQWFIPPDTIDQVWNIRLTALCVPAIVIGITFTHWFARLYNQLLASVGLAAGVGLITIQMLMTTENSAYYYPALVLVTFYTYNFIGTRFIYALGVDLLLLAAYNLLFGGVLNYPAHILATHDFFIISANLIGGTAGYLAERQKRILFLREREVDNERQHHMKRSLHDQLTSLPNRELLYDRIDQAMAKSKREGTIHCGFFLDLDGFKLINDNYSHEAGDQTLKHVAKRLNSAVRCMDTVARIGGDEFFVLAVDIGSKKAACALASKLLDQFSYPIPGISEDNKLSTSIGMCIFPYEGMTVSDIIRRADSAMYNIKSNGKNGYAIDDMALDTIANV